MNKKTFIGSVTAILILSLTWVVLTPIFFPGVMAADQPTAAHPGFAAPEFTLETPEGSLVSLSDYEGRPVLVFLWASWCSVCKATLPGLQTVYEDFAPQGFEILAVNMTTQDTLSSAISYFQSQGYTFPMLIDADGQVAKEYQMHALPTSILIGPDGVVLEVTVGAGMNGSALRAKLDQILAAGEGE
ncbi:MAG TPA: hypothetical protein DF984_01845 [Anaerolineaceae bacterium]|nr:hypothetical protein [Anaerolineaceae bacterium]